MSRAATVDAQCLNYFQKERLSQSPAKATEAIWHIFKRGHIALDEEEKCYQEWLDCACGPDEISLKDWVAEQLAENRIRLYKTKSDPALRKNLRELGLPAKDHKWIHLSRASGALALVSEDSDFYEPASKCWNAAKKEELKEKQSGCVCSFVKRNLGIVVMRLSHVPSQF